MGCFRLVIRVGRARRPATDVPEEWSSSPMRVDRTRLIGPLAQFALSLGAETGECSRRSRGDERSYVFSCLLYYVPVTFAAANKFPFCRYAATFADLRQKWRHQSATSPLLVAAAHGVSLQRNTFKSGVTALQAQSSAKSGVTQALLRRYFVTGSAKMAEHARGRPCAGFAPRGWRKVHRFKSQPRTGVRECTPRPCSPQGYCVA